jgi:hypothetical protein
MTFAPQMDLKRNHPVVVHNNYVIGRAKKQLRFEHFHLWFIKDAKSGFECVAKLVKDPPPPPPLQA